MGLDQPHNLDAGRQTAWALALVTAGRITLLGAWFGATALMARALGPDAFGVYALCQTTIAIVAGCIGEPLDAAVMRDAPLHVRSDRPRALATLGAAFWLRGGTGALLVVVVAAAPWVASWLIFGTVDYLALAMLTAAGVLGDLLLRSTRGYFQVAGAFGRFMTADAVWQLGRALAVVALVALNHLSIRSALLVYVAAPYAAFAVAVVLLPRDVRRLTRVDWRDLAGVLHYAKWIAAATVMANVYDRVDLFLLRRLRPPADVGLFAAAVLLASIPDFVNGSVQTVLTPRVAPAHAAGRFWALQRTYLRYAVPAGLMLGVVAIPLSGPVIRTLYGGAFAASIPPFRLLVLGTLFQLVVTPLPTALLNFVAPKQATVVTAAGLVLVVAAGLAVIPRYGAVGAAGVTLAARVVIGLLVVLLARRATASVA